MSEGQAPTKGVKFELDGKEYYLRYSFATRKKLIAEIGGEEALEKIKGEDLPKVILAGMKASAPDMTLDELEELIDMQNFKYIVEKMTEAMGAKKATIQMGEATPASPAAADVGKAD